MVSKRRRSGAVAFLFSSAATAAASALVVTRPLNENLAWVNIMRICITHINKDYYTFIHIIFVDN